MRVAGRSTVKATLSYSALTAPALSQASATLVLPRTVSFVAPGGAHFCFTLGTSGSVPQCGASAGTCQTGTVGGSASVTASATVRVAACDSRYMCALCGWCSSWSGPL